MEEKKRENRAENITNNRYFDMQYFGCDEVLLNFHCRSLKENVLSSL